MNPLARLGATTGAVLLALSLASPAGAERYVHYDARGDVQVENCTYTEPTDPATDPSLDPEEDCTTSTDRTVREGDITKVVVRHSHYRVVLRTTFRELTRSTDFNLHLGSVRTNEGLHRDIFVAYTKGETELAMFRGDGRAAKCDISKTIDFADNYIEVRIPRHCLSRPRWVQAGVGQIRLNFTESPDGASMSSSMFVDDGLSPTVRDAGPVWSPRVHRG